MVARLSGVSICGHLLAGSLLICLIVDLATCFKSLPDRLHSVARLSLNHETHELDNFLKVDEYVDVRAKRSTTRIHNARADSIGLIHYNKLSSMNALTGRTSVVFDPASMVCRPERISDWQFADLRRVAINFHHSIDLMNELYMDVPIGPSVLLYAIGSNANKFKFVRTLYSWSLMSNVNVYTRQLDYNALNSIFRRLNIVLHVSTYGQRRGLEPGKDTLASALLWNSPLSIKFIAACQVNKRSSLFKDEPKTTTTTATRSTSSDHYHDDDDLSEHHFCSNGANSQEDQKLLFKIHYDLIEEYTPGSLLGRELDEFDLGGDQYYDYYQFNREPFMQPVGIGCWGLAMDKSLRDILWISEKGRRSKAGRGGASMSGLYVTSNSLKGISYVAYDATRHLLRLDREGRKSIYDLTAGYSYHSGEYSSSSELTSVESNLLAVEKCIVLEIDRKLSQIIVDDDILNQLLGLGSLETHYLGTQTIEHQQYEVYEIGVRSFIELPLLLQTSLVDEFNTGQEKHSIFVTYYVESLENSPRFIEVHAFEPVLRSRKLINRLEFVEFSWSLDVEPQDDPASQASDSNLRLFELESCVQSRASQGLLTVAFEEAIEEQQEHYKVSQLDEDELARWLMQNQQGLISSMQRSFADTLRISSLNLVDFKLHMAPSNQQHHLWIATSRIVSLRSGQQHMTYLGPLLYNDYRSDESILRFHHNRHSLEECLLDSVEYPAKNFVAHCPRLAGCIILAWDTELGSKLTATETQTTHKPTEQLHERKDLCHAYAFVYATTDKTVEQGGPLEQVSMNQRYLDGKSFVFELDVSFSDDDDTLSDELKWGHTSTYKTLARVIDLRPLDRIGGRLGNQLAILSGLRYSTSQEEPLVAHNANQRVSLVVDISSSSSSTGSGATSSVKSKVFSYCQLSCQLDEFCGSFSVCLGSSDSSLSNLSGQGSDCVLSTLRLTGERLAKFVQGANGKEKKFQITIQTDDSDEDVNENDDDETKASGSRVFVMYKDEACSLHPRDFLFDYKVIRQFKRLQNPSLISIKPGQSHNSADSHHIDDDLEDESQSASLMPLQTQPMSLEECASLSFEKTFGCQSMRYSNFTYCPMDSLCFVQGDDLGPIERASACMTYERHATKAYVLMQSTHMVVTLPADYGVGKKKQGETMTNEQKMTNAQDSSGASHASSDLKEFTNEKYYKEPETILRTFFGLSEEDCARECSFYKSDCLAFDSCRNSGKIACFLYSIRSPLSKRGAYFPLLEREQEILERGDVKLYSSLTCDHYHPKLGYLEVRLNNLLARQDNNLRQDNKLPEELEKLEDEIEANNERLAEQELQTIITSLANSGQQKEDDGNVSNSTAAAAEAGTIKTSSSGWIYWFELVIGVLLGCIIMVNYKHKMINVASVVYRRARHLRAASEVDDDRLVADDQL